MRTEGASEGLVTYVDWEDIKARLVLEDYSERVIWEPSGRLLPLRRARQTLYPHEANFVLTFVSRTGASLQTYMKGASIPGASLFNCEKEDKNRGWLVFPWEEKPSALVDALSQEETEAIEKLSELNEVLMGLEGLDQGRAIQASETLADMVMALAARRRLLPS